MSLTREPLFAQERQAQIVELINQRHKLLVPELCEFFSVSPATIRNDLNDLESRGLLKRTHGGAISNLGTGFEQNTQQKQVKNRERKEAIAALAAGLVQDGDTLVIDTGTTMEAFAACIVQRQNLTVVTNDLHIACLLEEKSDAVVHLTGGTLRKGFHCAVGPSALESLSSLRVDKSFLAVNGLTLEGGLTTPDLNQAEVKRAMLKIGSQRIVLCDSTKIGHDSFARVSEIDAIDILVTDSGVSAEMAETFTEQEIQVQIASC